MCEHKYTTLKGIFSMFWLFCTLRFQIFQQLSILTNHASLERLFIQLLCMHLCHGP